MRFRFSRLHLPPGQHVVFAYLCVCVCVCVYHFYRSRMTTAACVRALVRCGRPRTDIYSRRTVRGGRIPSPRRASHPGIARRLVAGISRVGGLLVVVVVVVSTAAAVVVPPETSTRPLPRGL